MSQTDLSFQLKKKTFFFLLGKREISELFVPDLHLRLRHHEQKICKLTVGNTVEVLDKSFFGKVAQAFVKTIAANGHLIEFYYRPIDKRG